jgi:hypothetical protein
MFMMGWTFHRDDKADDSAIQGIDGRMIRSM